MTTSTKDPGAKIGEAMRVFTEGLRNAVESEDFARKFAAVAEASKVRR